MTGPNGPLSRGAKGLASALASTAAAVAVASVVFSASAVDASLALPDAAAANASDAIAETADGVAVAVMATGVAGAPGLASRESSPAGGAVSGSARGAAERSAVATSVLSIRFTEMQQTSTPGARPGWGCGDRNHTHSGPPGNPSATSPCRNTSSQ